MMEPPAGRTAKGPEAGCLFVQHVERYHGTAAFACCFKGRVVMDPEVLPEPDQLEWGLGRQNQFLSV